VTTPAQAGNFKLFVVDDDADIVNIIKAGLSQKGFSVDAYTNPLVALDRFKPTYYHISLLDVKMPDMTGFELYRRLKTKDPNLKVAFMTAFEIYRNEFEKVLPKYDVKAFITKPVKISDLDNIIKKALE
jgi:two-component system, OmpR family, response regulator ChvI